MPDSTAGSWAAIGGLEFTNAERTIAYVNNFNLPIAIDGDCWCPSISDLLNDCADAVTGYTFPSTDPAPWYDTAIPESGDFLGFLTTEFDGLGSTFTRNSIETLNGGAVLGRLRPQARTLTWRGYLFGRTCCAAEYGLRWLTAQLALAGGCDGCDGPALDILLCCPDPTGSTPITNCNVQDLTSCETGQSLGPVPALGVATKNADAFRTFYRTGLVDGPKILSQRTLGCGGDCEDGPGCLIEAEFSILCGNPYMHRDTVDVCVETPFPSCDAACDPNDPIWVKINTLTYPSTIADAAACSDSLDCDALDSALDCITDPDCPTATLPTIQPFVDPCGCEGFFTTRLCCSISNDIYGQFFEGIPTISIFPGKNNSLKNVVVSFYENPQERTCADTQMFKSDCFRCAKVNVRYIPANTTLTLDGLTKRITAKCVGRDAVPAESLTVSPFAWPVLKCIGYLITVEADCSFPVGADSFVSISVTPREM